jgi:gamma-glutamylcyclotransferase (GGCT)/AIG2-like uncharacterized protein YtfP
MFLFVYGTLRRGESAAELMRDAEFIGMGRIRARVIATASGYMGLVEGDEWIEGEIYLASDEILQRIDPYEGPGYVRRLSPVFAGDQEVSSWVYWLR